MPMPAKPRGAHTGRACLAARGLALPRRCLPCRSAPCRAMACAACLAMPSDALARRAWACLPCDACVAPPSHGWTSRTETASPCPASQSLQCPATLRLDVRRHACPALPSLALPGRAYQDAGTLPRYSYSGKRKLLRECLSCYMFFSHTKTGVGNGTSEESYR